MATGDLQNSIRRLQTELKACKYTGDTNVRGLISGSPSALLPLLHFGLLSFSYPLAHHLSNRGYDLYGKSDARFVDTLYKVLRDEFHHTPRLTKSQLLTASGFAEHKSLLVSHVLKLCKEHHTLLTKKGGASVALASRPKTVACLGRSKSAVSAENGTKKSVKTPAKNKEFEKERSPLQSVINSRPACTEQEEASPVVAVAEGLAEEHPLPAPAKQPLLSRADPLAPVSALGGNSVLASAHAILSAYPDDGPAPSNGAFPGPWHAEPLRSTAPALTVGEATSESSHFAAQWPGTHTGSRATDVADRHPPPAALAPSSQYPPLSRPLPNSSRFLSDDSSAFPARAPTTFPSTSHLRQTAPQRHPTSHDADDEAPQPAGSAPRPSVSAIRSHFSPPRPSTVPRTSNPVRSHPIASHSVIRHTAHGGNPSFGHLPAGADFVDGVSGAAPALFSGQTAGSVADGHQNSRPACATTQSVGQFPVSRAWASADGAEPDGRAESDRQQWLHAGAIPAQMPTALGPQSLRQPHGVAQHGSLASSTSSMQSTSLQYAGSSVSLAKSAVSVSSDEPAPEINQVILQMNAMSAQLGFVSTQLSQLLLADHGGRQAQLLQSAPSTAIAAAVAAPASTAVVPARSPDVGHALETIEARLVLMETRMHRLEHVPSHGGGPPVTSATAVVADKSIEWTTTTASSQSTVFASQPPFGASNRSAAQRPQDISISQSTVARAVTVEQSSYPVSGYPRQAPDPQISRATTVSTVDISYVFSDPSTQAFVSGLKNRVKETRRVLTDMSPDDNGTISSSLQQQILLAATSSGAPSFASSL